MLIVSKFNGYGRDARRLYFLDMGGDAPPPPDYTPVANASKESAEIAAQFGREQLAEAQRQYNLNMMTAKPVVDTQLAIMNQSYAQGEDYYNYSKQFRPLEQQMLAQAQGGLSAADMVRLQRSGLSASLGGRTGAASAQANAGASAGTPAAPRPPAQTPAQIAASLGFQLDANGQPVMPSTAAPAAPAAPAAAPAGQPWANVPLPALVNPHSGTGENNNETDQVAMYDYYARQGVYGAAAKSAAEDRARQAVYNANPAAYATAAAPAAAPASAPAAAPAATAQASFMPAAWGGSMASATRAAAAQAQPTERFQAMAAPAPAPSGGSTFGGTQTSNGGHMLADGVTWQYDDGSTYVNPTKEFAQMTGADVVAMMGATNDPRTYLHNGEWVDPRTVPGIGGTTYAGPADANGYIAGTAPPGAQPMNANTSAPAAAPASAPAAAPASAGMSQAQAAQLDQEAYIKALLDQNEMDEITAEQRSNAAQLQGRTRAYEQDAAKDIALYTGGDSGILTKYGSDIEADVGRAVADARMGQTQAQNSAIRQAMRYGISAPTSLAGVNSAAASAVAAAANNTRNTAVDNYRNIVGQGIGLKQSVFSTGQAATMDSMAKSEQASTAARNMRIQNESLDWAKKLDVTGMARGMPGASQGAYGVAVGAGNSAVGNQMAPGQALVGAMGQSANTALQGRQIAMNGLNGVLNAQANYANAAASSGGGLAGLGSLLGGAASMASVFSDARLKTDIMKVGDDPRGFGWYEFTYVWGGPRHRGVLAQEIERVMPDAVTTVAGFKAVNYALL